MSKKLDITDGRKIALSETNETNTFIDLLSKLKEICDVTSYFEEFLRKEEIPQKLSYCKISAIEVFDYVSAEKFNLEMNGNDEKNININFLDLTISSVEKLIEKKKKPENKSFIQNNKSNKLDKTSNPSSVSKDFNEINFYDQSKNKEHEIDLTKNIVIVSDNHQIDKDEKFISLDNFLTHNENNHNLSFNRNGEIRVEFFTEKEVSKDYKVINNNDNYNNEEFKKYFLQVKEKFKKNLVDNFGQELALFDKSIFVFLVLFENNEGKPMLRDLGLFDPLNNFQKYSIREEDLKNLKDYHFFNGQIVIIQGEKENNNTLSVIDLKYGIEPDTYILEYNHVKQFFKTASPYCIYAMAGPYFGKNEINLVVFIKTIQAIAADKPHLVIFNGPFLNQDNYFIQEGYFKKQNSNNPHDYMSDIELLELMLSKINETFMNLLTQVLIVPSIQDVFNLNSIPQPPFEAKLLKNYKNFEMVKKGRMRMISNPNTFNINEMIVGNANFDFSSEIIRQSLIVNKSPADSTLEMILKQKSYFPILPIGNNRHEFDKSVKVNYSKLQNLFIDETPDIIFTSSVIKPSVKKIFSTLFINMGNFYKGNNLGHLARIMSYSPMNEKNKDVLDRIRIDILKIEEKIKN